MRKGLFAVVMVAASFAGGAAANGPALARARAWLREQVSGPASVRPREATPGRLAVADGAPKDDATTPASEIPATAGPALVLDAPRLESLPAPRRDGAARPDAGATRVAEPPGSSAEPAPPEPLDPKVLDLGVSTPESSPPPPAIVPAPGPAPAKADPVVAATEDGRAPRDWAGVRRQMTALGVTRYWVEGEPGGPSRFRCVIPALGGEAVGQHFEADGDDVLQAAESALRRVALWKATEQP